MRVIIKADDLTGGSVAASLLRREGLPSWTHLLAEPFCGVTLPDTSATGCHVLALDTRNVSAAQAARRLGIAALSLGASPDLVDLRIDSTLRGPIAASLEAMLAQQGRLGLVVPAFGPPGAPPGMASTTSKARQSRGRRSRTIPNRRSPHPLWPNGSASLAEWVGGRTNVPYANLSLADVRHDRARVSDRLAAALVGSARIIFCDAKTDGDIEQIARGALDLQHANQHANPGLSLLPADPGSFTATLVRVMREPNVLRPQVFGVMCSIMQTATRQMDFVEAGGYATIFRYEGQLASELLAVFRRLSRSTRTILLRTDTARIDTDGRIRLHGALVEMFPRVIAAFPSVRGLFLSGGETAAQLLTQLGVRTLSLRGEVGPLATLSRIGDGALRGMILATKGGSVGKTSAIADLLGHLYDALADDDPPGVASPSSHAAEPSARSLPPERLGETRSSNQKVSAA
jgi:uncharacterized protein YgbK (DUF1537 family)